MAVAFNTIPSNLRVPLFYAEINAGQSPYQGPSRLLLVGQKTAGGSAPADAPIRLDGDPQSLAGAGSMLAEMAIWARQNHPFGEIWLLPIADPAGDAQTFTVTIAAGIAGKSGTLVLYVAGEKVQVAVTTSDTNATVATNLAAAINAGYHKFDRPLTFPVIATVASNVVTLTARNAGVLGGKIGIDKDLVGDEGPLQQYATIAAGAPGTGTPSLSAGFASLGDTEFDWIGAPYADPTSLAAVASLLNATSGRWSPLQQLYGHYVTSLFDSFGNLASAGSALNDPSVSVMGVVNSPSPPWRWASALAARIAFDKNLGGEVDQAYRLSQPLQTLELLGIVPPKSRFNWFSIQQRNQLYQDGISGFRVTADGKVLIDRILTTYQVNSWGQQDITWLDVETRAQVVYFTRFMRQRITQIYGRMALASDGAEGRPGIVTPRMLKAECVIAYKMLEAGGLVEKSDLFAESLVVERSADPNRVNAYLPIDVVNQLRVFAANVTTFLEYAA
ncbi:MAG TPA: phage tail sheath subtilisin-like domain-containing protein [Xanthobacteraceae bacterium]|nr:phage tail sheath subtilisin-like domain-containing protein [Xanthobacteraceae bacterium]